MPWIPQRKAPVCRQGPQGELFMNITRFAEASKTVLLALAVSVVLGSVPGLAQFPSPSSGFGGKGRTGSIGRGGIGSVNRMPPVNRRGKNVFIDQTVEEDLVNPRSLDQPFATVTGTIWGE